MLFFGFLVFIFLIIIRPQDFWAPVMGTRIVFYTMGVLLVVWIFSSIPKNLFQTALDKFVGLFFLAIIVSTLSVNWVSYSVEITIETFKQALIYFFAVTIIDDDQKFKLASWTLIVLMTVLAGVSILQYYGINITGAEMMWSDVKRVWQITMVGIFDNPNDIAYSVVLVIPFALGLFFHSNTYYTRISAIILFGISGYCIYISKSRGGYLAATFCILTWLFLWINNKTFKKAALVIGFIGLLSAFYVQSKDYREEGSAMGRVDAWVAGMHMLESSPIIGVGKGQFREHHKRDSHSSYVRAGSELGLMGLYAFVGIIYSALIFLIPAGVASPDKKWKIYQFGYISYLAAFVVASLFSTRTYDIVFLVVIALIANLKRVTIGKIKDYEDLEDVNEGLMNKQVVKLTILTLFMWKIFLIQTW